MTTPDPHTRQPPERTIGLTTGSLLIVANMIGTGVFITTGGLVQSLGSGPAVLAAWVVGGVAALCGALCYAELGAALPRNGGEFLFLSRVFHPVLGFLSGWVSALLGFCAPLAVSAVVFGMYLHEIAPSIPPQQAGTALIAACTVFHSLDVHGGHRFQNVFTAMKLLLILVFLAAGVWFCHPRLILEGATRPMLQAIVSPEFAVGLVFVSYAYSGWNAAAYVAGEFRSPGRVLPLAMIAGTLAVTVLYVALNALFLASAPAATLAKAKLEEGVDIVGFVAAIHLFGSVGGRAMALLIVLGLVSSAGAFLATGARVLEAMGRRHSRLGWLAVRRAGGGPIVAIALQAALALVLLWTATADALLEWVGLTLSIITVLAVLGLFVMRFREPQLPRPYRTWGYPLTPIVFLALQFWMITHTVVNNPQTAYYTGLTLLLGAATYFISGRLAPDATG